MSPTKLQRWLDLIAFLAARHLPVSFEQIMEGVPSYAAEYVDADERARSSVRRKFERDKADLREAGIPIETVAHGGVPGLGAREGYRLAKSDFHLPYLRLLRPEGGADPPPGRSEGAAASRREFALLEDELRAALEGLDHLRRIPASPLAAAAESAVRKLTFDLTDVICPRTTTLYLDPPGAPDPREALEVLFGALRRRKRVTFRYRGMRKDDLTDRRVEPYGLVFGRSRWYLVGKDTARQAVRTFRVSRMEAVCTSSEHPKTPDYEVPADFDLAAHARRDAWQLASGEGRPIRVRVRLGFPHSLRAARNGHGTLVEEHGDGSSVREFDVADAGAFLRWLLPQGNGVAIEFPVELREELARLAERVAILHSSQPAPPREPGPTSTRRARGRAWKPARPEPLQAPPRGRSDSDPAERLARLFHVIAKASRPEGASLAELARELGVDSDSIVADLREIQERDLYHPSGSGADFQISIEPRRVRVWTKHDLARPLKLTPLEALALWLGLEIVRVSSEYGTEQDASALRDRLRRHLAAQPDIERDAPIATPSLTEDPGDIRRSLEAAVAGCRVCRLRYLKATADRPEERSVRPYGLVHAEGEWYLLGHSEEAGVVRAFRLDRVLAVEVGEERFVRPPDFDPAQALDVPSGRVLDASAHQEARVRYSARIARWIAERDAGDWLEDGSFAVRHEVADPEWLVRHVLQYAGEAEVVEPPALRALVASAARRIWSTQGTPPPPRPLRARGSRAGKGRVNRRR
jgi:proteasome accessory factor B/proteasome accessory factor C